MSILTPKERAEYDDLMFDAGYDSAGKPRPSHEVGARVAKALRAAADQAHRTWAELVLEDLVETAALHRWKQWQKQREVVEVRTDAGAPKAVVVTKPAAMSVRRIDADSGQAYYQLSIWDDMTRDELLQVIHRSSQTIKTSRDTSLTAQRLLALLNKVPEAKTVADAARALGTDVASYLGEVAA